MKKTVILTFIGLGLCLQAQSETLSTTDGTTYDNITAKRAEPDGLYVEYTPAGGGLGMAKIKFSRLSSDQQKQFGYDAGKARDFETKVAKATDDWREENIRREQLLKAEQQAEQAREDQTEQAATQRLLALAQLKEAEADLARSQNNNNVGYGWPSAGNGVEAFAIPEVNNQRRGGNDHSELFPFLPTGAATSTPFIPFVGMNPFVGANSQTAVHARR